MGSARPGYVVDGAALSLRWSHWALRGGDRHVGGVIVFTLAHAVITVTCRVLIMKALACVAVVVDRYFLKLLSLNFDWEMMTPGAIVGMSHALDFHRKLQDRELNECVAAHAAGRSKPSGVAASTAPAFPVQHAGHAHRR